MQTSLVDINAQGSQVLLRLLDLAHEFLVRLGGVAEGEDAPAEAGEEVRAERDEEPEGKLNKLAHESVTEPSHTCVSTAQGTARDLRIKGEKLT